LTFSPMSTCMSSIFCSSIEILLCVFFLY
jgi:hypothetical protein